MIHDRKECVGYGYRTLSFKITTKEIITFFFALTLNQNFYFNDIKQLKHLEIDFILNRKIFILIINILYIAIWKHLFSKQLMNEWKNIQWYLSTNEKLSFKFI